MRGEKCLKILFCLMAASVFLPWFTYDASIMGYCYGVQFLKWFIIPMAIIAHCLFKPARGKIYLIALEFAMLCNLAALAAALGRWQEERNIISGFHWAEGLHTATSAYWLAAVIFISFFIALQPAVFQSGNKYGICFYKLI